MFAGLFLGGMFGWLLTPVQTLKTTILKFKPDSIFQLKHFANDELKKQKIEELTKAHQTSGKKNFDDYSKKYDSSNDNFLDSLEHIVKSDKKDSLGVSEKQNIENDIVVKKDELIFVKITDIINKNRYHLDSLLTDAPSGSSKNSIKIEFWLSPVNYNGYKMTDNKLIIYGIQNYTETMLITYNNSFFLRNYNIYYPIEKTESFKPLVRLTNQTLISQLNNRIK